MPKKGANFQEEIENSEKFLQKLQTIKKTSKEIKDKNKLTQHKNLWVKEQKYLSRLERDMDAEISSYFEGFDIFFESEIEEKQIFGATDYKSYSELKKHIDEEFESFEAKTFQQIQSLPLLMHKCKGAKKEDFNRVQILEILGDIQSVLDNVEADNRQLEHELLNREEQVEAKIIEENLEEYCDEYNFSSLKSLGTGIVKGFDFERQKIQKLKEAEDNLMNYLECFNEKLSEDEIFEVMHEFNQANSLLEETHHLELEKIALDYEEALSLDSSLLDGSLNFNKINHIYQTYIGRGKSVSLYNERLAIEFPKMSRASLDLLTRYMEAKIYKEKKTKAAKRNYYFQKEDLFNKVDTEIHTRIEKKILRAKKQAESLARREERLNLEKELEVLRAEYNKRQKAKEEIKTVQLKAQKEEEAKKQSLRKEYLEELNQKASEVKQIKSQKAKEQERKLADKKRLTELENKRKIEANKPKVSQRQSVERRKIEKKVEKRQWKEHQGAYNEERIKKAVEGYSFRPEVDFSEQRLNRPTETMIKRKETKLDKADKVELSKMTGYSVNQLMTDMRFKVNNALQEAGLSNTEYAREMLAGMSKRPTSNF